jgi:competence protein ComEC
VLPGQRVRLAARLQPPLAGDLLTAVLEEQSDPVLVGQPPWWQRAAGVVRSSLRSASVGLPQQERGLLPGLIDGDTSGLDPVLSERFRVAGLTHLVAVSGTNCVIIVGAALLVLRRFGAGPLPCAMVGFVVLSGFVLVARPSPSVLRAAVMAAIALVALASGRQREGVPMVSAAVLGLLAWRPELAVDAGFAMSVLATGGRCC